MTKLFEGQQKQQYLDSLNSALRVHPGYKVGMRFVNIELAGNKIRLTVAPPGISKKTDTLKALDDIAQVLTLSGDTLGYEIVEGEGGRTFEHTSSE